MRFREIQMPLLVDTRTHKTDIGAIPNAQATIDHQRISEPTWGVCAGAYMLAATERTEHQGEQNQDLEQTFKFHGHFSLWKIKF
jgi:hypothetical protein